MSEEEEGVSSNPTNFLANLRKLMHIYDLSQKKRNEDFQKRGVGVKVRLDFFQKDINFGRAGRPLASARQTLNCILCI